MMIEEGLVNPCTAGKRDIANSLKRSLLAVAESRQLHDLSLFTGRSGVCLALVEYAVSAQSLELNGVVRKVIENLIEDIGSVELDGSLGLGLAGTGVLLDSVSNHFAQFGLSATQALCSIDEQLLQYVAQAHSARSVDLVTGLAGIGLFATISGKRPSAKALNTEVLRSITALSEELEDGTVTWPHALPLSRGMQDGIDLGMAHGVPGIVYYLSRVVESGQDVASSELLRRSVSWILSRAVSTETGPTYPYVDGYKQPARVAWCYGDVGVSMAIVRAGHALRDPAITEAGFSLVRQVFRTRCGDADDMGWGICHGAAGVSLIFDELARVSGDALIVAGAEYWRAAAERKIVDSFGSLSSDVLTARLVDGRLQPGILDGLAGALCYLSPSSPTSSAPWYRCFF